MPRPCEVCQQEHELIVSSLPGMPISIGRCQECLAHDAIPLYLLVANTAAIDGMQHAADWWKETVQDTLAYLRVDRDDFDRQVAAALEDERRMLAEMQEREEQLMEPPGDW